MAKAPDTGVDREVVLNSLRVVLQAGFQTASRFLATGLLTLLRVPPGERVVVDTDKAVHELVRHCGPVHVESRACVRDTVLGGRRIRRGQIVSCFLGAANRDASPSPTGSCGTAHPTAIRASAGARTPASAPRSPWRSPATSSAPSAAGSPRPGRRPSRCRGPT
ncbi:hypothetical protein ACIQTN_15190 [Streptomyces werraensis]|uniref:hypothetical protein n=1 Tax=Streptomyces werraensis TaxID=68284 RepID=UPI0037FAE39B